MELSSYQKQIVASPDELAISEDHGGFVCESDERRNPFRSDRVWLGLLATAALAVIYFRMGTDIQADPQAVVNSNMIPSSLNEESDVDGVLGDFCYRDSFCHSGHCSARFFSILGGNCVECTDDEHCEGHGRIASGEKATKSFCVKNVCSEWKRGKPIGKEGYPVWFHDSVEPFWLKRHIMPKVGPVMEHVWYWDLDHQPQETEFTVNETHATITMYTPTISGFSRTQHMFDEHETGITVSSFLTNPISVITPYSHSGMIEKTHTLTYTGNWSTVHVDRIREERAARGPAGDQKASDLLVNRSYMMGYTNGYTDVIISQVEAAQDIHHLDQIRAHVKEYVKQGNSSSVFEDNVGYSTHKGRALQALEDAKTMPSMKSEQHCKHFEQGSGIVTNETHMVIPLNTAITILSGEMVYAPTYHLGINGGLMVAKFDSDDNALVMYHQAFQAYRGYSNPKIPDEDWPYPSGIWLGAVSESSPVSPIDGRNDEYHHEKEPKVRRTLQRMIDRYLKMPIDYDVFDKPDEKCPQELQDKLADVWDDAELEEAAALENPDQKFKLFASLHNTVALLRVGTEGAPCGWNFMSSDYGPGVVGLNLNEYSVWAHLILEVDPDHTGFMATSKFWDDWETFLKEDEVQG